MTDKFGGISTGVCNKQKLNTNCIICNKDYLLRRNYMRHLKTDKHMNAVKLLENNDKVDDIKNEIVPQQLCEIKEEKIKEVEPDTTQENNDQLFNDLMLKKMDKIIYILDKILEIENKWIEEQLNKDVVQPTVDIVQP